MNRIIFQEYLHAIDEIESRIKRIETAIHDESVNSDHAPVTQALQGLRGVTKIIATGLVAEGGNFSRFEIPRQLMSYAGLVHKEVQVDGRVKLRKQIMPISVEYL